MLTKKFIRINLVTLSVCLFLVFFGIIHFVKPEFIYTNEGGFRAFGIGYKQKTVVPIWLVAIFLAMLCYAFLLSLIK